MIIDFESSDTISIAENLIGQFLCLRNSAGEIQRLMINETEAYDGPEDGACHAHMNRRTKRTEVMFQRGGCNYVYLCYGIHWLLNIVTGAEGYPAAVLIRGAGHYDGPGKLTRGLGIDGRFNSLRLGQENGLWIEPNENFISSAEDITRTPRIGIDYAGPYWSKVEYRFLLHHPEQKP
ncbi:MAG: DNA-3-methyladenine glycosylase [Verrucomicrobiota bacterium]